jgi:hypothetical protein
MTFGEDWGWGASREEARKLYGVFREAGGNFIDTANVYTNGASETLLGEFMAGHRESVVLATKYTNAAPGTDPNAAGNHRKSMMQSVEASLKRLKTDCLAANTGSPKTVCRVRMAKAVSITRTCNNSFKTANGRIASSTGSFRLLRGPNSLPHRLHSPGFATEVRAYHSNYRRPQDRAIGG